MEEYGEQYTVVLAKIVTESASGRGGGGDAPPPPSLHTHTLTSRFRNN